jgi:hypothetical protein
VRPTVEEQLAGSRRILEDVIAPELSGAGAVESLNGLVKNLELLERSWTRVLPFLHWDNEHTAVLLRDARAGLPAVLADRITADAPVGDPFDVAAAQDRNDRLRGLLSEVVAVVDTDAAAYRAIVEHMRTRTGRFPLRMVPDLPGATS